MGRSSCGRITYTLLLASFILLIASSIILLIGCRLFSDIVAATSILLLISAGILHIFCMTAYRE